MLQIKPNNASYGPNLHKRNTEHPVNYHEYDGGGDAERRESYGQQEDLHGAAPEGGVVHQGRPLLHSALLLDLTLVVLGREGRQGIKCLITNPP